MAAVIRAAGSCGEGGGKEERSRKANSQKETAAERYGALRRAAGGSGEGGGRKQRSKKVNIALKR